MTITKELNGQPEETGVAYISTSDKMAISIMETAEGNLKIIHLSNTGKLLVQPNSNNSIELIL